MSPLTFGLITISIPKAHHIEPNEVRRLFADAKQQHPHLFTGELQIDNECSDRLELRYQPKLELGQSLGDYEQECGFATMISRFLNNRGIFSGISIQSDTPFVEWTMGNVFEPNDSPPVGGEIQRRVYH